MHYARTNLRTKDVAAEQIWLQGLAWIAICPRYGCVLSWCALCMCSCHMVTEHQMLVEGNGDVRVQSSLHNSLQYQSTLCSIRLRQLFWYKIIKLYTNKCWRTKQKGMSRADTWKTNIQLVLYKRILSIAWLQAQTSMCWRWLSWLAVWSNQCRKLVLTGMKCQPHPKLV